MDCDSHPSLQDNITKSPIRPILSDNTNTRLLDNTRKRSHNNSQTEKPQKEILPDKKRPKQDTPSTQSKSYSFFSLFRNPLSIFYRWNPVKDKTPTLPADPLAAPAPKLKLQRPMQGAPDPLAQPASTLGPTISPWAYLSVRRDEDDLSSILTINQRSSVSKNVFQTQTQTQPSSSKTIFKNDLFARKQNERYLQMLESKSIPIDNLTSASHSQYPPSSPNSNVRDTIHLDTTQVRHATRLSSSLLDPPHSSTPAASYRHSRALIPDPISVIKLPPSRNTNQYRQPKYEKSLATKYPRSISLYSPTPTNPILLPRKTARHKPINEQDDIHIVSVALATPPPCILSTATNEGSDILRLRGQFDLERMKKEFEEEELNAYNRKKFLSDLERKQSADPLNHRPVRTRGKPSIEELKDKMEKLVYTLESDIEDSRMPTPYKPVELGDEMELRVTNSLINTPIEEVLSSGFRLHIKRKDMSTLQPSQWLNDEIINFYCSMIADRSTQQTSVKPLPSVHTFNTFFYTQLKDRGYDSVKRWTRKVDIFSLDMIIIPIHLGMHWCMSIIDFRAKTVTYHDSFHGSNDKCLNLLFEYLHKERLDKKGEKFDSTNWKRIHAKEIPEQKNSSDCGVFACQFAEFITRDAAIGFTQEDMPLLRRQMVAEVLNKKLYH